MKTYSERRFELQNPQILKKMLAKSSQFLSSKQPCEPKSIDVALNIAGPFSICMLIMLVTTENVTRTALDLHDVIVDSKKVVLFEYE